MKSKKTKRPLVDGAGHVDPRLVEGIRQRGHVEEAETAFLGGASHSSDPLAEHTGEAVIEAVTSGQDDELEHLDEVVTEEVGGPFVESNDQAEMAEGTDASNIEEATRNPFPTT